MVVVPNINDTMSTHILYTHTIGDVIHCTPNSQSRFVTNDGSDDAVRETPTPTTPGGYLFSDTPS